MSYRDSGINRVFKLFLEGKGYTPIAKYLNSQGILSPLMYLQSLGLQKEVRTSGVWTSRRNCLIKPMPIQDSIFVQRKEKEIIILFITVESVAGRQLQVKEWVAIFFFVIRPESKRILHAKITG